MECGGVYGNEVYGNSLHFPLIFCKPNAALKNKVY